MRDEKISTLSMNIPVKARKNRVNQASLMAGNMNLLLERRIARRKIAAKKHLQNASTRGLTDPSFITIRPAKKTVPHVTAAKIPQIYPFIFMSGAQDFRFQ